MSSHDIESSIGKTSFQFDKVLSCAPYFSLYLLQKMIRHLLFPVAALCSSAVFAAAVDPLTVDIGADDARRFANLMKENAVPAAEILQREYLDRAGPGVKVFTPMRIVDAGRLARKVAANPEAYRYAIRECLPRLPALRSDLKAIYLAFSGLLPERSLPAIEIVFGALNSGGTASSDMQVIGLEVTCPPGTTPEQFRTTMRGFFAHETVHTWQGDETPQALADPLLSQALREGVADYLATLVTGEIPTPARDAWARQRESWLWEEFQRDRQFLQADSESLRNPVASPRFKRWFVNCGSAPEGWPCEAGYWIGMRIAEAYVNRSRDKRAAIRKLLELENPAAILKDSGWLTPL
ncbi:MULTISPECIES: hypothetical protein [unclassified Duganella]|uniref:gliding motility protein GldB-related protein n=1 Tax=unclassified Duganella TaxID=2636909 RepID=UPI00071539AF|nr:MULTISPECIES: hypothetical protein [unclassified Duganella]KRC00899.1 hypothetical protein ASE26_21495 [Duganella sp. Root198D2]